MKQYTYDYILTHLLAHGCHILEVKTDCLIVWENIERTVVRADHFDYNGQWESREVLSRP